MRVPKAPRHALKEQMNAKRRHRLVSPFFDSLLDITLVIRHNCYYDKLEKGGIVNEVMRAVTWVGDSRKQVRSFPKAARRTIGEALRFAQRSVKHPKAKPLRGIGSGVLEITARYDTNTYRVIYAVRIGETIYVLHAFQKKATRGSKTPKREIDLIRQRLNMARAMEMENE